MYSDLTYDFINMHLLLNKRHNILMQCHDNYTIKYENIRSFKEISN